ncbi:MAG: hypothetical protein AAB856_02215 [Patescibacteria group bacterium]
MSLKLRSGQVAMVVILVVLVGLTIGVAVLGRSVTNVGISLQEEERARSFSAAEAGVEDALRQDLSILAGSGGNFSVGDSAVTYTVAKLTNVVSEIDPGEVVTVNWAKSDPGASSFSVNWTNGSCGSVALISTTITPLAAVTHASFASGPQTFNKGTGGLVRFRIAGCRSKVTITGQGGALSFFQVDSKGTSGTSSSKVQVVRSAPAASGLLDFALFSGGNID